ncbi:Ca2+-binding RTX toxin-like protein [Labrenzia sp. EL_195]|nr:Ca2+-binding RTX toxin-like protein [Labrenzia sp. EL_195]
MTLVDDFMAKLDFSGASSSIEQDFRNVLEEVFSTHPDGSAKSPTAYLIFSSYITSGHTVKVIDDSLTYINEARDEFHYDSTYFGDQVFINDRGNTFLLTKTRVIIHEFLHVIRDWPDLAPEVLTVFSDGTFDADLTIEGADYLGRTPFETNEIIAELMYPALDFRSGFFANLNLNNTDSYIEEWGRANNFTGNKTIDNTIINYTTETEIDTSNNGKKDLILGNGLNETINVGDEDDFVYGGSGIDTIFGGSENDEIRAGKGADYLFGGSGTDKLFGDADNDDLSGGTKDNVLTQLVLAGGTDETTHFYDDEEQDLLEGGTGADKYYIHRAQHTYSAESAQPFEYFDFIEGWNINRQERNGIAFDDTLQRWDTVDRVSDVDRAGEIRIQDNLAFSLQLNGIAWNFDRISYQGVDFFADEEQKTAVFVNDGDLFVMRSYRQAEFGDQIDAYWSGYVATVIIEDFNNGDFNFTVPTADQGTSGDDTPTLTPGGSGDGAYYHGLDGDDVIIGTVEGDALRGDAGNDQISGGDGDDDVSGGDGNDTVSGEDGNDFVSGGAGNDILSGGAGNDWIRGGTGRDTISGGAGDDTIYFDNGDYFWTASVPVDIGGSGTDTLIVETGSNFNTAGLSWYGFERFQGADGDDRVDGNDSTINYWMDGGAGNDLLTGNAGNDTLLGGDGDDILRGGAGQDEYSGGAGNDTIYYGGGDLFWDGGSPKDIGGTGIDTLIMEAGARFNTGGLSWYGFERFEGAERDDRVDGNDASVDYWLDGGAGNDSLKGHGSSDTLIGGTGDDGLTGGAGSDTFVFRFAETGHDTISDFSAGAATDDIIEFSSSVFSSFAEVLAAATDDGVSSTITIDANTSVILSSVLVAELHQDDFNFI